MQAWRVRSGLGARIVAVALLESLAGVPLGGESSAHSRGCALPSPYFGSGWRVRSATLALTRTGTWERGDRVCPDGLHGELADLSVDASEVLSGLIARATR